MELKHTWEGLLAHLGRPGQKTKRCKIGKLCITEKGWVRVEFEEDGKTMRKPISPIFLAALNILWLDSSICSDDEEDNSRYGPPVKRLPTWEIPDLGLLPDSEHKVHLQQELALTNIILQYI